MKLKRLLAAGLAGMMTIGALAGCGNSSDGGQKASSDNGSNAQAEGSESSDNGEVVDLKWVIIGNGMPDNYDS